MQAARRIYPETPWIVGGDFNMIITIDEKKGGIRRPDQHMDIFNEMITEQTLVDMPTINGIYIWNNRRGGKNQITSRLDRFLVLESIMNRDVFVEAKIMPAIRSDHGWSGWKYILRKIWAKNHSDLRPSGLGTHTFC